MYNLEKMSKRVRHLLGEPTYCVELTDESMESLIQLAINKWKMFSSLHKISTKQVKEIEYFWVESYFQALCKESLGMIRGKFDGIQIPGSVLKLNYKDLISSSEIEKKNLEEMLNTNIEKTILALYVNVENLKYDEINEYMSKIIKSIKDPKLKCFAIATKGEPSRIECLFPNFTPSKEVQEALNNKLLSILKP